MNLISCDNCGVVLDVGKLDFPVFDPYDLRDVDELFAWDKDRGSGYLPYIVPCATKKSLPRTHEPYRTPAPDVLRPGVCVQV